MNIKKIYLIIAGIILVLILLLIGIFASTNNKAISLEEQIGGASASIEVQEKRRVDLIYNLVDTVKEYAKYESATLEKIIETRKQAASGDVEDAKLSITAVAEQYPDLKASENYKQLMTELALTENMIAEQRNNYNMQIKAYNKFTRKFPSSAILALMGYEKIEFSYTEYSAPQDAPQNLFEDK